MRVVVGSQNPVKIEAVREAFAQSFKLELEMVGIEVSSGVSPQPKTDLEILTGARNRATAAREKRPDADFWIGIESGVELLFGEFPHGFDYVVVLGRTREGFARSVSFPISRRMHQGLIAGMDLSQVMENRFGVPNAGAAEGAIGYLTHNAVTRKMQTVPAVATALIPFLNELEYFPDT